MYASLWCDQTGLIYWGTGLSVFRAFFPPSENQFPIDINDRWVHYLAVDDWFIIIHA